MRFRGLLVLLLLACDSPTEPRPFVPGPPHSFNLRDGLLRLLTQDSAALLVEMRDSAGYLVADSAITWSARDPHIASVSAAGKVTAHVPGWTVIRASRPGFRDSAWIGVSQRYKAMTAGLSVGCGINLSNALYCWGDGWAMDHSGVGRSLTPLQLENGVRQVVVGWEHACLMKVDQTVWCWGRDQHGQLGNGEGWGFRVVQVQLPEPLVTINASQHHTCGLTANDDVYCWGINDTGELGIWPDPDGIRTDGCSYLCRKAPVRVPGVKASLVSAGLEHTCALSADGVATCWGANETGQLGIGMIGDTLPPQLVNTTLRFKSIDAGYSRTCAISMADELYCWGQQVSTPTRVEPGRSFKAVSVFRGICALTVAGELFCMRDGVMTPLATDVRFSNISVNDRLHCALSEAGGIYCWGGITGTGLATRDFPIMIAPPGPVPDVEAE